MAPAVLWLTRDLRLRDHPALRAALDAQELVVPAFCFDDRLLGGRHASGPRTRFLLECLADLRTGLQARGGDLVLRRGPPEREIVRLAGEIGARAVHATEDVGPFARRRADRVRRRCEVGGIALHEHPGLTAVDDVAGLRTRGGRPYTVFTPFHRAWLERERRPVLPPPRRIPPLPDGLEPGALPSLEELGLSRDVTEPLPGGESAGRARATRFLRGAVHKYASARDRLAADGTSRLSPYLHLGCLTPRQLEERLPRGRGADAFRRQLAWRDFHHHVLANHPGNARAELQDRYRGAIRWNRSRRDFDAWREGQTGYPLVDAAMRQLRREGWIHNRARLVAASFLTKQLGIDWRWGERWFMRLLLDGDEANNNGNWQWIASVGTDPQPAFRRLYNPARHQERFDPDGSYVRRYVPELRPVAAEYLAEPCRMPPEEQRRVGCVIGEDYPEPIVDQREARQAALARYRV
jgi:deoxyribodipyrimidine photo-lyase